MDQVLTTIIDTNTTTDSTNKMGKIDEAPMESTLNNRIQQKLQKFSLMKIKVKQQTQHKKNLLQRQLQLVV